MRLGLGLGLGLRLGLRPGRPLACIPLLGPLACQLRLAGAPLSSGLAPVLQALRAGLRGVQGTAAAPAPTPAPVPAPALSAARRGVAVCGAAVCGVAAHASSPLSSVRSALAHVRAAAAEPPGSCSVGSLPPLACSAPQPAAGSVVTPPRSAVTPPSWPAAPSRQRRGDAWPVSGSSPTVKRGPWLPPPGRWRPVNGRPAVAEGG